MKFRLLSVLIILAVLMTALGPETALAGAYATSFTTSVTYQNVGTAATTKLQILFYEDPTDTTPIVVDRPSLAANAGTSVFIGSLSQVGSGFRGSAIMSSDQPLLATLVQLPQNSTTVKNRPLSNGFAQGSAQMLIATVLKNTFDQNTIFSVQNVDSEANNVTLTFYRVGTSAPAHSFTQNIAPGAAFFVDAGQLGALGSTFNGSAVITAARGNGSPGSVVASAMELNINGNGASAFEGVGAGARNFYMPSALCNAFGGQNSSYAVQNTDLSNSTHVVVTYSNGLKLEADIAPGAKASFITCDAPGMPAGFSGSATVTSNNADIIAIGKVYGLGLSTAFLGEATGGSRLALPYVRWSESQYSTGVRQRTFIAIQNVSGSTIPANGIIVDYLDKNGTTVVSHTIAESVPNGGKVNSTPFATGNSAAAEFGYYPDNTFGGSAIVRCASSVSNCQLVVVARVASQVPETGQTVAEDYNGIPIP